MFFKCKVCLAKDEHINSLKEEVRSLRQSLGVTTHDMPLLNMEAQKILEGSLSTIVEFTEPTSDRQKEMLKAQREAEMILSGDEIIQ